MNQSQENVVSSTEAQQIDRLQELVDENLTLISELTRAVKLSLETGSSATCLKLSFDLKILSTSLEVKLRLLQSLALSKVHSPISDTCQRSGK